MVKREEGRVDGGGRWEGRGEEEEGVGGGEAQEPPVP